MSEELFGYDEEDVILQEVIYQERQPQNASTIVKTDGRIAVKGLFGTRANQTLTICRGC
jgi:hypothetical protein